MFVSDRARTEYLWFTTAATLVLLTTATLPLLSVLLVRHGMRVETAGYVIAAPLIPLLAATAWSGWALHRLRPLTLVIAGQLITLIAFVALQVSLDSPLGAALCRVGLGIGFGLSLPAMMVYVKNRLVPLKAVYAFGLFSATFTLTQALGPGMAEWYLRRAGDTAFFYVMAGPLVAGLLILLVLRTREDAGETKRDTRTRTAGYGTLLADATLQRAWAGALALGLMWGFITSFLSLLLVERGQSPFWYFLSCGVAVLWARIWALRDATVDRSAGTSACALVLAAAATLVLLAPASPWFTLAAGLLGGAGFGLGFPVLSTWVSARFDPDLRGRPVALFNALNQIGVFVAPLIAGTLWQRHSATAALLAIAAPGALAALYVAYSPSRSASRAN